VTITIGTNIAAAPALTHKRLINLARSFTANADHAASNGKAQANMAA
jgi:hypothetical protein